jgi:hypothetical protein
VRAWGDGEAGTAAPDLTQVSAIASTQRAFASLSEDGSVTSWGEADAGGDGAPAGSFTAIASTSSAFAALATNGSIAVWGDAARGGRAAPTVSSGFLELFSNKVRAAAPPSSLPIRARCVEDQGAHPPYLRAPSCLLGSMRLRHSHSTVPSTAGACGVLGVTAPASWGSLALKLSPPQPPPSLLCTRMDGLARGEITVPCHRPHVPYRRCPAHRLNFASSRRPLAHLLLCQTRG